MFPPYLDAKGDFMPELAHIQGLQRARMNTFFRHCYDVFFGGTPSGVQYRPRSQLQSVSALSLYPRSVTRSSC